MVSHADSSAYSIHLTSIKAINARASKENWTPHQRRGCTANDSANIKADIEHDLVTNKFVGMDESHRIGALSGLFHGMAQKVKDASNAMSENDDEPVNGNVEKQKNNSILDNLRLAEDHLIFKFTSISPDVKCSEIIASINIEKVTPEIIATVQELLMDTLPIYGLSINFGTSDAAGCNWVGFNSISTHKLSDILPKSLQDIDPSIDYDLAIVYRDEITNEYTIFIPDMPHLSKNIVTALELSGVKKYLVGNNKTAFNRRKRY